MLTFSRQQDNRPYRQGRPPTIRKAGLHDRPSCTPHASHTGRNPAARPANIHSRLGELPETGHPDAPGGSRILGPHRVGQTKTTAPASARENSRTCPHLFPQTPDNRPDNAAGQSYSAGRSIAFPSSQNKKRAQPTSSASAPKTADRSLRTGSAAAPSSPPTPDQDRDRYRDRDRHRCRQATQEPEDQKSATPFGPTADRRPLKAASDRRPSRLSDSRSDSRFLGPTEPGSMYRAHTPDFACTNQARRHLDTGIRRVWLRPDDVQRVARRFRGGPDCPAL